MAERPLHPGSDDRRSPEERAADHAGVERLTSDLLPALIARLVATGLGEVELREEGWRLRVRRPASGNSPGRHATDRPGWAQPGHAGHGHQPAALEGHRGTRATTFATNGSNPGHQDALGDGAMSDADAGLPGGTLATSPAVGIFQPRHDLRSGLAVTAGERLGVIDVLGISQEILAPSDGLVGLSLAEAGHAVEYGQPLLRIELTSTPPPARPDPA